MKPIHKLLAMAASLAFVLPAPAAPDGAEGIQDLEAKIRKEAGEVEARARHLHQASQHLREAGMEDQAAELEKRVGQMRQELETQIKHLREVREKHAAQAAGKQAEAERQAHRHQEEMRRARENDGARPDGDGDRSRDEAYKERVAENWERIREAGGDRRPQAPDPQPERARERDHAHDAPPPPGAHPGDRPNPGATPPVRPNPGATPGPGTAHPVAELRVLSEILRTLQRIEAKMDGDHKDQGHHGPEAAPRAR